jgi:hypothetical protein
MRLVITEGLLGSGNASRVIEVAVGPRVGAVRRVAVEWVDATQYAGVEPAGRRVEGDWRPQREEQQQMSERQPTTDDVARAVFAAAAESGEPVPNDQSARLIGEIEALTGSQEIQGFAIATVDDDERSVIVVMNDEGCLLRFKGGVLRVTFLGNLPGLHYEEHLKAIGGMPGYPGHPWVRLLLEHERLPGRLTIEAEDWRVSLLDRLRASFRGWAAAAA